MCKELCKEVSESALHCINERFDAFEAKSQSLAALQAELQSRMANQEQAAGDLDARMVVLEAKCTELEGRNTQLHTKVLDFEVRSRRHNIKIVGIQEGDEDGRPMEFVSKLIPKLLGVEHFLHPVNVDRAHHSLQPKPANGTKPCTILARRPLSGEGVDSSPWQTAVHGVQRMQGPYLPRLHQRGHGPAPHL